MFDFIVNSTHFRQYLFNNVVDLDTFFIPRRDDRKISLKRENPLIFAFSCDYVIRGGIMPVKCPIV